MGTPTGPVWNERHHPLNSSFGIETVRDLWSLFHHLICNKRSSQASRGTRRPFISQVRQQSSSAHCWRSAAPHFSLFSESGINDLCLRDKMWSAMVRNDACTDSARLWQLGSEWNEMIGHQYLRACWHLKTRDKAGPRTVCQITAWPFKHKKLMCQNIKA